MKIGVNNLSVIIFIVTCLSISSGFNNRVIGQIEENDKNILINKAFTGAWEGLAKNAKLKLCVKGGRLEGSISQGSVIKNGVIDSQSTISENELFVFVKGDKDRTAKIHLKLLGNRQLQISPENKNSLRAKKTNHNKGCYASVANNKAVTIVQGGVVTTSGSGSSTSTVTVVQGGVITSGSGSSTSTATVVQGGVITSGPGSSTGGTTTVIQGGVITSGPGAVTPTPVPSVTSTPVATATPMPKPTATSTPVATATPMPKPTVTSTPVATATPMPKPTATSTPVATPMPKPTATSTPVATPMPKPTATSMPVATPMPTPVATSTTPQPPTTVPTSTTGTTAPTTTKPPTVGAPSTGGSNK